jgi:anti-sigma B factor antagonist
VPTTSRHVDAHTLVVLRGDHDRATVDTLATTLARATAEGDDIVVDLSAVTFIDAVVIGTLVRARNAASARGQSLRLRAPSACAARLIELCRLDRMLETAHATAVAQALSSWVQVPRAPPTPALSRRANAREGS